MKILMKAGASWDEAADAGSAAMTELFSRWGKVTGGAIESPQAYVRSTARRIFVNKRIRDEEGLVRAARGGFAADPRRAVADELVVWEGMHWVKQMLDQLPAAQREVMELQVLAGLSSAEISVVLGKTPSTVRKNRQLARETLRRILKEDNS